MAAGAHDQSVMNGQPEKASRIHGAVRRLSSVFMRRSKPGSDGKPRPRRRSERDSVFAQPNKEGIAPPRSAIKGNRWSCILDERRVGFADFLPRVDIGPPFKPFDAELTDGQNGLPASVTPADDNIIDGKIAGNRKRACTGPMILESANRNDSSIEPITSPKEETSRSPKNKTKDFNQNPTSPKRSLVMTEDKNASQNSLWPLPLFADRSAGDRSSSSATGGSLDAQDTAAPQTESTEPDTHNSASATESRDNASAAYQAHVDRSLQSVRGLDKRRSTYLRDSLVQLQEALGDTSLKNVDNPSEATDNSGAAASIPMPTSPGAADPENADKVVCCSDDAPAPPIPPRHPGRRLIHMINDMRFDTSAESIEVIESARDSGISVTK